MASMKVFDSGQSICNAADVSRYNITSNDSESNTNTLLEFKCWLVAESQCDQMAKLF